MPRRRDNDSNEAAHDPADDAIAAELVAAENDEDVGEGEDDESDDDMSSFALMVGEVADYLEDNASAVFETAIGTPLDPDDPLLEKLILGAFARRFLDSLLLEMRQGGRRKADLDKLSAARGVVDDAVISALRHFSGGKLKEIAWRGADDEHLLAFAYAVAAAWQVGATADALLDMELGLDPDQVEKMVGMLEQLAENPGLLANPALLANRGDDEPDRERG